jgi:hypothetical protein
MSNNEKVVRLYGGKDAEMIQKSRIRRENFLTDLEAFVEEDPDFDQPFSENWLSLIDECASFTTDKQAKAEQTAKTKVLLKLMQDSINESDRLERFVDKAFPGDKSVHNEFGFKKGLSKISQEEMMDYVKHLYETAKKYQTQLISSKYSSERIEALNTLYINLYTADTEQEEAKQGIPALTKDRIEKLNELWKISETVNKAANIIFKDNPEKRNRYKLVERKPKSQKEAGSKPETTTESK